MRLWGGPYEARMRIPDGRRRRSADIVRFPTGALLISGKFARSKQTRTGGEGRATAVPEFWMSMERMVYERFEEQGI